MRNLILLAFLLCIAVPVRAEVIEVDNGVGWDFLWYPTRKDPQHEKLDKSQVRHYYVDRKEAKDIVEARKLAKALMKKDDLK